MVLILFVNKKHYLFPLSDIQVAKVPLRTYVLIIHINLTKVNNNKPNYNMEIFATSINTSLEFST